MIHDPFVVVFVFGWDVGPALNRNVDDARIVGPVLMSTSTNHFEVACAGKTAVTTITATVTL